MKRSIGAFCKIASVVLLLFFFLQPVSAQPIPTPDFPVGLTLTYQCADEYFMHGTISYVEKFEVTNWLTTDNDSFELLRSEVGDPPTEYRNVSYPSWDYLVYVEVMNETWSGSMYPLWRDVTSWNIGQNVSIGYGTYSSRDFRVISQEEVFVEDVSILCWVAQVEYIGANDWEYTERHHYDTQYGVLIKKYSRRYPGFDDPGNIGTFTDTLIDSSILDKLQSTIPYLFGIRVDNLLIVGIVIEVVLIGAICLKGRVSFSSKSTG